MMRRSPMSEIGTYTFLPWLRSGLANRIETGDLDTSVKLRATVDVELDVKGTGGEGGDVAEPVSATVALYGPGDIVGIEAARDHPQRAAGLDHQLRAQLPPLHRVLRRGLPLALHAGGTRRPDGCGHGSRSSCSTEERVRGRRQPARQAAAVHRDHGEPDGGRLPARRRAVGMGPRARQPATWSAALRPPGARHRSACSTSSTRCWHEQPDLAYSRLLCPRKLAANTAYHAFLVPTFETGRLAGLGLDPATAEHATASAWGPNRDVPTLTAVLPPLVLPHRHAKATSSTWCGC